MGLFNFFRRNETFEFNGEELTINDDKWTYEYVFDTSNPDERKVVDLLKSCRTKIESLRALKFAYVNDLYNIDVDRLASAVDDIEKTCLLLGKYKPVFSNVFSENIKMLEDTDKILDVIKQSLIKEEEDVTNKIADDIIGTQSYV